MKIVDVNNQQIKAAASFNYKGYEISFSSVMNQMARVDSVGVFNDSDNTEEYVETVEDAIEFIEKHRLS